MSEAKSKTAIIIGGGPAGLTAALELLERTDIKPIVYEAADDVGGISRTHEYKGNHIDIGGHRFFSKSDRVMDWWSKILPLQGRPGGGAQITYQNSSRWLDMPEDGPDPDTVDDVMLVRPRTSRILWRGKLFDYPLSLNLGTLAKLGPATTLKVGLSYLRARLLPIRPETSLRDFLINRFGRELYATFFKDYTEKVWGVPCEEISADWGAQRIKGLSLSRALLHAVRSLLPKSASMRQKETETTLIEQFLYPKYGPGHIWRRVTEMVRERGGEVHFNSRVTGFSHADGRITGATMVNGTGEAKPVAGDFYFSTMPVRDLIDGMQPRPPVDVKDVSDGLLYRDFITVGILLTRLKLGNDATGATLFEHMPDNWIYVQEPGVKVGRLQFFNNWSPYLVADPDKVWVGMEYFCDEGDALWAMDEEAMKRFAIRELASIGVIREEDAEDAVVIHVPKTYPAYFGSYERFDEIRSFTDGLDNLYLLGRNGMHRYNNQDHSMLTAMVAVDNIVEGRGDRENIWSVNTEEDYHEEK